MRRRGRLRGCGAPDRRPVPRGVQRRGSLRVRRLDGCGAHPLAAPLGRDTRVPVGAGVGARRPGRRGGGGAPGRTARRALRCGGPGAAIVEGDGGTGKTRLAEELAGRARLDGAVIAAVRAVEADQSDAWSGLLGIARAGLLDAPGIAAASPAALAGLRGSAPLDAPARAFSEALRVVADEQPVVVMVDDAHWLDRESLLALGAAARDLTRSRVLLLITAAPHACREELDQVRAHLGRELAGTAITLGPLTGDALREIARWGAPSDDAVQLERLSRRVVADSAGIPLLAVELLNAAALGLDLQQVPGVWPQPLRTLQQTFPGDLPDVITAAVRVNFHRLSSDARGVLVAAAVLDGRVPAALLGRAAGVEGDARRAALDAPEAQLR